MDKNRDVHALSMENIMVQMEVQQVDERVPQLLPYQLLAQSLFPPGCDADRFLHWLALSCKAVGGLLANTLTLEEEHVLAGAWPG